MADVIINKKIYESVTAVELPLADGNGTASFLGEEADWFRQVFKKVGTFDIETLTIDTNSYFVLSNFDWETAYSLMQGSGTGTKNGCLLITFNKFDVSQNDAIAVFRNVNITNAYAPSALSSGKDILIRRNATGDVVRMIESPYTIVSNVYTNAPTALPVLKSDSICTSTQGTVYVMNFPLA